MTSRANRIEYLLRVMRALLKKADEMVLADTEYLRDEISDLQDRVDVLLEKMQTERDLLALRDHLHAGMGEEAEHPTSSE